MKTAVEWFANRISHGGLVSKKQFNELLEQAKEMEQRLRDPNIKENWTPETSSGIYNGYRNKITNEWLLESEYIRKFGPY